MINNNENYDKTFVFRWNNNGSGECSKHSLFLENKAVRRVEASQEDLEHVLRRQGPGSAHREQCLDDIG